jgi:hypothetical protein
MGSDAPMCAQSPPVYPSLSITDILPSSSKLDKEQHWLMVYKCYFDGGAKDDSALYDTVSLAVTCGFADQWGSFNKRWKRMLNERHAPYLHTTDLITGNGPYEAWSKRECDDLGGAAIRIIERSVAHRKDNPKGPRQGIIPIVISISLKDFLAADKSNLNLSACANELLFRQALGIAMQIGIQKGCTFFNMFFDQNEPFYGYMHDLMVSKRAKKDAFALEKVASTQN